MLIAKLAFRNIKEAGLRTWLNVAALSLTFLVIVGFQGLFDGMLAQSSRAMIDDEIAGGQFWNANYDPYDPLTLEDSHGSIPKELTDLIYRKEAAPILMRQVTIYPEGRMQTAQIRGIDPNQTILNIPSGSLASEEGDLPVLIGKRMAQNKNLRIGDYLIIRYRDAKGTFDAVEGKIVKIMNTQVPSIDNGIIWVPLKKLRQMTVLEDEATIVVVGTEFTGKKNYEGWGFKSQEFLMSDLIDMIKTKKISSLVMYFILLFLGMLAIFDTQVLSIFRRKKEIGTLIALGMTRMQVIVLFTLEGALQGVLALLVSMVVGFPLLWLVSAKGLSLPQAVDSFGFALADKLYPVYTLDLVIGTVLLVMAIVTIVSLLPTRTIAKLNPTEAIQGKIS